MAELNLTFRPIAVDELPAFARTGAAGFGEGLGWFEREAEWVAFALDRTLCAFDGDELVGTSRNYPFELTVPGGGTLPAAGVSAVAVLPTHRRRGILRAMITRLLDDAVAHGEALAMLTASEAGIYERFGFGVTTRAMSVRIDTRDLVFTRPRPEGVLRLVDADDARKVEPSVFERVRRAHPGAISRPDEWWCAQYEPELGVRFDVLYQSPSGTVDGYVTYGIRSSWGAAGFENRLAVRDFVAVTPEATHALWRYLGEVDLVRTITCRQLPLDSPLPWLLASVRAVGVEMLPDYVWTRLLDVPAALAARTYATDGRLALEVRDPERAGGDADGTFSLDGGPDGAAAARDDSATPDLVCDIATASAAWLGGLRWAELAGAGLVEERAPGALARADAMFASTPLPYPFTWF